MNSLGVIFAAACLALASARPELGINPHVVGGTVSPKGSFPFVVSLRDTAAKQFYCGGALVSENFVMTAAHCVSRRPDNILVGLGSVHLSEQTLYEVEEKFVFPNYKPPVPEHDLALLKLKKPVTLSPTVQTIDFPYTGNLDDKEVTAMGWGLTSANGPSSSVLLHLNQTVVPNQKCRKLHNVGLVKPGHVCFSGNHNKGVCFGDSGSPLLYVDGGKKYTVGVVSFGIPCAVGVPDVYVRVSHYANWLKKTMDENK